MKRFPYAVIVAGVIVISGCGESHPVARNSSPPPSPFAVLDAYGEWLAIAPYGQVWQPRVAYDWQPFLDGEWVWTDRGWMWQSYEPFGWVVYHYGYWANAGATGWVWVPGREWAPARVRWTVSDNFIGWAPLPPPGYSLPAAAETRCWVSVEPGHFTERHVGRFRSTGRPPAVIDPGRSAGGRVAPDPAFIERFTHGRVVSARTETVQQGEGEHRITKVNIVQPPVMSAPIAPGSPGVAPAAAIPPAREAPRDVRTNGVPQKNERPHGLPRPPAVAPAVPVDATGAISREKEKRRKVVVAPAASRPDKSIRPKQAPARKADVEKRRLSAKTGAAKHADDEKK
jgi:hypothetical protein